MRVMGTVHGAWFGLEDGSFHETEIGAAGDVTIPTRLLLQDEFGERPEAGAPENFGIAE